VAVTERLDFVGSGGEKLAARLDRPIGVERGTALFAHCFTCSKDLAAASRISRALAERGFAVLRFDFTGLGHSEGEFANTNFSSNVEDLVHAAEALRARGTPPGLLIGHSLGGAAVLAAAGRIPEVRAVATLGAPADPSHVEKLFTHAREQIEREGQAEVDLAGRRFTIRRQLLVDLESQRLADSIAGLRRALLVMHAPLDDTVGIENASRIFQAARHPKSFVSLDGADHLLTRKQDAEYAAEVLSAWAGRFLATPEAGPSAAGDEVVVREVEPSRFAQDIAVGAHALRADEPRSLGGDDTGPTPYGLLLAALGACTAMTVRLYARRKQWPLEGVEVRLRHDKIHAADCAECETQAAKIDRIEKGIVLQGELSDEQRERLLEIADRCPVHRTLQSEVHFAKVALPPRAPDQG
jgi:putative redox protein